MAILRLNFFLKKMVVKCTDLKMVADIFTGQIVMVELNVIITKVQEKAVILFMNKA